MFLNGLLGFIFLFLADKSRTVKSCKLTEVQMPGEFILQTLTEVMGNAFDATRMQILQCGLAVLVVSSQDACGKYIVRVMLKILSGKRNAVTRSAF